MQINPLPQSGQDLSLSLSARLPVSLQLGEIVEAEVLNVTETAAAIRMKGTIFEAQTSVQLKEGDTIRLRVEGWENQIRLRLLPNGAGDGSAVRNMILAALTRLQGAKPAAQDLMVMDLFLKGLPESVKAAVPGLAGLEALLPSVGDLSATVLRSSVKDSGVFLETKLRLQVLGRDQGLPETAAGSGQTVRQDLKAMLLLVHDALAGPEVRERLQAAGVKPENVMASAENLLRNIELLQLQSKLNETLQVFIPFVWKDLREGDLVFRESEQDRGGGRAYCCTVNLDLERAGKVSTQVLLQEGAVHVTLTGENERFLGLLEAGLDLLSGQLAAAGLRPGTIFTRHAPQMDFTTSRSGRLDIKV
jgi:hypothetical protein